jgi:hypothetical protein
MHTLPADTTRTRRLRRLAAASAVWCTLIGILATATRGETASPPGAAARCARIAFAKQSDDLAFNIRVSGAQCSVAHAVASASPPTWPAPPKERAYTSAGFACTGRLVLPNGKAYVRYICLRRGAKIVFDRA